MRSIQVLRDVGEGYGHLQDEFRNNRAGEDAARTVARRFAESLPGVRFLVIEEDAAVPFAAYQVDTEGELIESSEEELRYEQFLTGYRTLVERTGLALVADGMQLRPEEMDVEEAMRRVIHE